MCTPLGLAGKLIDKDHNPLDPNGGNKPKPKLPPPGGAPPRNAY